MDYNCVPCKSYLDPLFYFNQSYLRLSLKEGLLYFYNVGLPVYVKARTAFLKEPYTIHRYITSTMTHNFKIME